MEGDMTTSGLVTRQWESYGTYHQNRANLIVHMVAVPAFMLGNVLAVAGAAMLSPMLFGADAVLSVGSIAAQGRGHRSEPVPAQPFAGPADFVKRIFAEQWITFPRFVLSGTWRAKLAESANVAA
jgi:hypothetical protein